jgi:CheY-like chemotaxis protein
MRNVSRMGLLERVFLLQGKGESAHFYLIHVKDDMPQVTLAHALRVQVVDDCPSTARSLRRLLGLWGYEAAIAFSGEDGLELASSFRPNVILLDIELPRMHGGEVARRLREIAGFEEVLIIAATAIPLEDPRLDDFRENFDAYIQKPFNLERLESLLRSVPLDGN